MAVPELLRKLLTSPGPSGYEGAVAAVWREAAEGFATVSSDAMAPSVGSVFYYLIRAENSCPGGLGLGPIGTDSNGTPRTARPCP